jgi:uncharacterized protein YPO0396
VNTSTLAMTPLSTREQYRMRRLQVFNWGTFSQLHEVPIAERGFLFVGRSGAGKSTLLDAFTALLTPPRWADFNLAARESERGARDRNLVTYIRGAWAEQEDDDSGEIAMRYLRTGTTWSALALTYRDGMGHTVVLVQILWLRGTSNNSADVRRHFLIFERPFDLREIAGFDLDIRKLKQQIPEVFARDEFRPYCERFRRLLGIEDEMALRLLHKTQSAKNLGDLNTFIRDFMLEKPETFEVADRLVVEFAELNAAHQGVVTARDQVRTLLPARAEYERIQTLNGQRVDLDELRLGLDAYRESLRMRLLAEEIGALQLRHTGLQGEARQREETLDNRIAALREFQNHHRDLGGDRIEQWEAESAVLERERADRLRKRDQAQGACRSLGRALPDTPQGFADLLGDARQELDDWKNNSDGNHEQLLALDRERLRVQNESADAERELEAMRRQPSNIPAHMLAMRESIARALHLPETALPFVGELIEVRSDEALWRGAIERVLHGFALSLVVEDRHYAALSSHVNATHFAGQRLVYFRMMRQDSSQPRGAAANSLITKLTLKDGDYRDWLRQELHRQFDYTCVDTLAAFRATDRALTREGQVKHNRSRHEKDDRRSVDDRRYWVLGFDNRDRRALFEERARSLTTELARLHGELQELRQQNQNRGARVLQCNTLINLQWGEIDVALVLDRIAEIAEKIREAREDNPALQEMSARIKTQEDLVEAADKDLRKVRTQVEGIEGDIRDHELTLTRLRDDPAIVAPTPHQNAGLAIRFAEISESVTLASLEDVSRRVERGIHAALEQIKEDRAKLEKAVESRFADFRRAWPVDAGDLDATLASAPDFLAKLERLEHDNLPAYEERFFELLQSQSHQNLAALSQFLRLARNTILDRLALVNESLSRAEFNAGTFLRIDPNDRQLEEVREFKQNLDRVLDHAWTNDRERAEERFLVLRNLVERLGSQDPELRRWREAVLDVRLHVEFIGREVDAQGVQVEIYRSGAGKSGGQRQKLATTCLAAALRYQLGGQDSGLPLYAPVILDEAFDKADSEFTTLAMNIFTNFGFQMIVATPLKSVMTLEPFIGGACFVDITDRRNSGVLLIEYDVERQRLRLPNGPDDSAAAAVS